MGIPDEQTQKAYNLAHQKAMERLNNRNSFVKPIDPSSLTEEGREYREKMNRVNQEPTQLEGILARLNKSVRVTYRQQVISFEIAHEVFYKAMAMELTRKNKGMVFTPEQTIIIDNIIKYFIGDPTGPYLLQKGLFVYGSYGVGKTILFRIMQLLCQIIPIPDMEFAETPTKSLYEAYVDFKESKEKKVNPLSKFSRGNLLLNDLGEESQVVISYKNEQRPMDLLLDERNIAWDRFGAKTHVTSNLGMGDTEDALEKQLNAIYGTRILDRFMDMFNFIFMPGESKRG